jgi:hypothetical protein
MIFTKIGAHKEHVYSGIHTADPCVVHVSECCRSHIVCSILITVHVGTCVCMCIFNTDVYFVYL